VASCQVRAWLLKCAIVGACCNGGGGLLAQPTGVSKPASAVSVYRPIERTGPLLNLFGPSIIATDAAGNVYLAVSNGLFAIRPAGSPLRIEDSLNSKAVAVDHDGNLFVADERNHRVRKIDAVTGLMSTVVGSGKARSSGDSGPAIDADVEGPTGLAFDLAGNLFIAEGTLHGHGRIRMVSAATGFIATVAGNGTQGDSGDGGPATSAQLHSLGGIALDGKGNLYIADNYNNRIRMVSALSGIISTVVGTGVAGASGDGGLATDAQLNHPLAVAIDSAGDLYIADSYNHRVRKVAMSTGTIATLASNGSAIYGEAPDRNVTNGYPCALAFDKAGNLYVTDSGAARVRKIPSTEVGLTTVVDEILSGQLQPQVSGTGLVINVSYGGTVPSAAQTAFNAVVAKYKSVFNSNVTVNLNVNFGNTGLGQSSTYRIGITYSSWRAALLANAAANPGNPNATSAAASLPAFDPIGQGTVYINTANARAIGLSANTAVDSTLTFSNSVTFEYTGLSYTNAEDFMDVAAHELDEALGIGSNLNGLADNAQIPADGYVPEDYFRFSSAGTRAVTTNPNAVVYFSYDGGNTNVAQFNQAYSALGVSGLDRNDWVYGDFGCPAATVHVQNAILCYGQAAAIGTGPEITVLNSLGYALPGTNTVLPSVFIDSPVANATLTGTVGIGGWAIENTSTVGPAAVSTVTVWVDNVQVGTAAYGTSRSDVCAAFPGRSGCPNVGWTYSLNTSGLSAGSHALKIVATDTTSNSSSREVSFAISPIVPSVYIDSPVANAALIGTVGISGWAIENTSVAGPAGVGSVKVYVDDIPVGTAAYGNSRPDVCAVFLGRLGCPNVGWTYNLNASAFAAGNHTLKILATDTANNGAYSQVTFTVPPLAPSVYIDNPAANATLSGTVGISGWAIENISVAGPAAVSAVTVWVDGVQVGTASYGSSRADVCAAFPARLGCPNVGWTYNLNASAFSVGGHTLKIVATDTASNSSFSQLAFNVQAPGPSVIIDSPVANAILSGTVGISGWAIENIYAAGPSAVSNVTVWVDGGQVGTATFGLSRADVCAVYPGRLGCPNVGWTYNLNASAFAAGGHTLKIVATDTAGNSSFSQVTFQVGTLLPSVYIDFPTISTTLSGTAVTSGWAMENTTLAGPAAVSSVQVYVDNVQVGTATYGLSRPDVCAAFPARLGCPNVGWSYSLNTSSFTSGVSHTLKIIATDTAGNASSSQVTFLKCARCLLQPKTSVFLAGQNVAWGSELVVPAATVKQI
jgi:sugar lactone lactonase YvrE